MNPALQPSPNAIAKRVEAHPFLRGLKPEYLHWLAESASLIRFGMGEDIFRERQPADRFYLIVEGRVTLETFLPGAGMIIVQSLGPGEALGLSWLYPPYEWQFTARAVEPVLAIAFNAAELLQHSEQNSDFGHELAMRVGRVMRERLQTTRRRLIETFVPEPLH